MKREAAEFLGMLAGAIFACGYRMFFSRVPSVQGAAPIVSRSSRSSRHPLSISISYLLSFSLPLCVCGVCHSDGRGPVLWAVRPLHEICPRQARLRGQQVNAGAFRSGRRFGLCWERATERVLRIHERPKICIVQRKQLVYPWIRANGTLSTAVFTGEGG